MKGSSVPVLILILGLLAVVGMVGFIFFSSTTHKQTTVQSSASNNNASAALSAAPVKDFAPNLPMSQKTTILIQTSDSSDIKYVVPTSEVNTYVKQLPPGYHIVSKTP